MLLQLSGGAGIGCVWGSLLAGVLDRAGRRRWSALWIAAATLLVVPELALVASSPWVAASFAGAAGIATLFQLAWLEDLRKRRGGLDVEH